MASPITEETVQVASFLLADHAEATGGKMYMTGGGWNIIYAPKIPHQHSHFSLAISMLVPWSRQNETHDVVIELLDADNKNAGVRIDGKFEAGRAPGTREGDFVMSHLVMNIDGLEIKAAGSYHFAISIDGVQKGDAPFKVTKVASSTG